MFFKSAADPFTEWTIDDGRTVGITGEAFAARLEQDSVGVFSCVAAGGSLLYTVQKNVPSWLITTFLIGPALYPIYLILIVWYFSGAKPWMSHSTPSPCRSASSYGRDLPS